jgi:hypothetical protein
MVNPMENRMLFHDEELDEKDLQKFFEKLDPTTIEQIKKLYEKE